MERGAFQDDLFGTTRWLERTTSAGVIVRVCVEPAGRGSVRVVRYERRRRSERSFVRRPREEGQVVPLAQLDPDQDWHALFGPLV